MTFFFGARLALGSALELLLSPTLSWSLLVGPYVLLILQVVYTILWPVLNLNFKKKSTQICFLSNIISLSSVQSHSHVQFYATPWTAAHHASLSITNSRNPPKPMSVVSVTPSNHLSLCSPLLLPSIFPSIGVFSVELLLCIKWPKYSASVLVLPMNIQGWLPFGLTGLISLQSKALSRVFSRSTVQKHQFFTAKPS